MLETASQHGSILVGVMLGGGCLPE